MRVTVVTIVYISWLTLHRSLAYTLCFAAGHVYVVKPKEKGYAQRLQLDVMV
jgi:hypothetical protein